MWFTLWVWPIFVFCPFSHHCGLGTCSRKRGAVGLSTSPGSGLEHVQIVVEWARERHIALVCFQNNSMVEPKGVMKAGGDCPATALLLCLTRRKGSSQWRRGW